MNDETPQFTKSEFKQIKYFVYFAIFIIVFQTFQYVITKNTTKKYRDLFSKTTELVILTNAISLENSNIHRAIINITFSSDSLDVKKFRAMLNASEKKTQEKIDCIKEKIITTDVYNFERIKLFIDLKLSEQKYKAKYSIYLKQLMSMNENNALIFRRDILRPLLEAFQRSQYLFLIKIFNDQQTLAEDIATDAGNTGFALLIAGNFLLVIIILFLVYILFTERKKLI